MSALVAVVVILALVTLVLAWATRDVAIRVLDERRAARLDARADFVALESVHARMTELEAKAERWDTAAREIAAWTARAKR